MNKAVLAASMRAALNQAERCLHRLEKEYRSQKINSRALVAEIIQQLALLYALVSQVDASLCSSKDTNDDDKCYSGLLPEE